MSDFFPQSLSNKAKDSYPEVVRVVALKTYKGLRAPLRRAMPIEDMLSNSYVDYLEIEEKRQDKLSTFDAKKTFAYMYRSLTNVMMQRLKKQIGYQKMEVPSFSFNEGEDVTEIAEKLNVAPETRDSFLENLATEKDESGVNALAFYLLGEALDTDNLGVFVKRMSRHKALIEKVEKRLSLPSASSLEEQTTLPFVLDENDNIQTIKNAGILAHGGLVRNPASLAGKIRSAIEEEGLVTTKDLKMYLDKRNVFYRDDKLNNYINKAFKALGRERPNQRLSKNKEINSFIDAEIEEGKAKKEVVKAVRDAGFDTSQFLDGISSHVNGRIQAMRSKRKKEAGFMSVSTMIPMTYPLQGKKGQALACTVKKALYSKEIADMAKEDLGWLRLEKLIKLTPFDTRAEDGFLYTLNSVRNLMGKQQ